MGSIAEWLEFIIKKTSNLIYSQYLYKQNTHPATKVSQGRMRAKRHF